MGTYMKSWCLDRDVGSAEQILEHAYSVHSGYQFFSFEGSFLLLEPVYIHQHLGEYTDLSTFIPICV